MSEEKYDETEWSNIRGIEKLFRYQY
jgi:hypothetical protein